MSEDTFQESVFPSRILRIREKVQKTSGGKKTGKYSYFDSEVNLLLVVLVCRVVSGRALIYVLGNRRPSRAVAG